MGEHFQQQVDLKFNKGGIKNSLLQPSPHSLSRNRFVCNSEGARCTSGRSTVPPAEEGTDSSAPKGERNGLLFLSLFGKKAKRQLQGDYKFKTPEQIYSLSKIQNGDLEVYPKPLIPRMLHGIHRLKRCLLPCPNSRRLPTVLTGGYKIRCRHNPSSIQGAPIWHLPSPKGLYKGYCGDGIPHKRRGRGFCSLPRRFFTDRKILSVSADPGKQNPRDLTETRLDLKPRKILSGSFPTQEVLGYYPGLKSSKMFPPSRKSAKHPAHRKGDQSQNLCFYKRRYVPVRANDSSHPSGPMGSVPLQASSTPDPKRLGPFRHWLRQKTKANGRHIFITKMVGKDKSPVNRQSLGEPTNKVPYYRCQPKRLGSTSRWKSVSRVLGRQNEGRIFKFQGAFGSPGISQGSGSTVKRVSRKDFLRQLYNRSLYKQARRNKKCGPDGISVQNLRYCRKRIPFHFSCSYKGETKHQGRLPKPSHPPPVRVVPEQGGVHHDNAPLGYTEHRSLCVKKKSSGRYILFPGPKRRSLGRRCSVDNMVLGSGICLSAPAFDTQGVKKDQSRKSQSNSNSPLLAQESMVQHVMGNVINRSMGTPQQGGFVIPGTSVAPSSERFTLDGLEFERSILRNQGFSDQVINTLQKSRKPVTYKLYFKVWKAFQQFHGNIEISSQCNISKILEFLQKGLEKGLKPATLRMQVSALGAFLNKPLAENKYIKRFMRAASRLVPTRRNTTPPWDLSLVLNALTKSPFEPIDEISLKHLTLKTAFLVAITSARRVGELSALVHSHPYTQILEDRVILKTDPAFLPKVVSDFHRNQEVILPSFCTSPASAGEKTFHTLDVRRSLLEYLDRSRGWRKARSLFVQFSGTQKGQRASSNSIARWLRQAIQIAYSASNRQAPDQIRAHSTRAVSTSWAEYRNASVEQICRAATWSSQNTFFKHYRLDLAGSSDLSFGRKVLQAVVPP